MIDRLPFIGIFYPILLMSLSVHEAAHAWMSNRKGDPTAKRLGRITLNPIAHMDFIGTLVLPLTALLTGAPLFGWGKPVPVDPRLLWHPRRDMLWIAAAGPISNVILAGLLALVARLAFGAAPQIAVILSASPQDFAMAVGILDVVFELAVGLNIGLALFNLIPVFPLDGGSVLRGLLPARSVPAYDRLAQYGMMFLILLFVSGGLRFLGIPITVATAWLLPH